MAEIFVSYKREERDRTEPVARALEREGFSVWWDPELPIGQPQEAYGATNRMIKVTLESLSTTLRPNLTVYDENKSKIFDKYDTTRGANLVFEGDLRQPRDFYIEVAPYSTFGRYRLRVD